MGKYETANLRNLGIVGQGDAGKTSLTEAILYNTGMTDRLGRVDEGTSTMDFEPEEIKRQITISSSLNHCEWHDNSLHIVDTPGYTNFLHDTRNCMRILGGAVLAEQTGHSIVPVAHNSGEYWPRRSLTKFPGTIQVRVGPVIKTNGKSAQQILDEASGWIEAQMDEITTLKE